jgi:ABC-type antimicrobial peptide transport system permease subunit
MLPEIANAVHRVDPGIATSYALTMSDVINGSESAYMHRACAWLIGGFAALALVLGVVGLYGVIAYSVGQRTREVGVRMALGAQRTEIYALVMRQAGWLTAIGLVCGLVCSVGASLLIRNLLFGVKFWDVTILACVVITLAVVSVLASFLPARRAASVNPVVALRAE